MEHHPITDGFQAVFLPGFPTGFPYRVSLKNMEILHCQVSIYQSLTSPQMGQVNQAGRSMVVVTLMSLVVQKHITINGFTRVSDVMVLNLLDVISFTGWIAYLLW